MACPAADYGGGDGPLARPDGVAVLSIGAGAPWRPLASTEASTGRVEAG